MHTGPVTPRKRLGLVFAVNFTMVIGLLVVGLAAHSLGVLASGADYLGDALGAGLSIVALQWSREQRHRTHASALAALANSSFLLAVTFAVGAESIRRLANGAPPIDGLPVIVVSVVAAIAMIACAIILGDVGDDLSMQSVMLDTVADAAAAVGVAITGAIILLADGLYWLDSLIALAIALVVGYHAARLVRKAIAELRGRRSATTR